MDGQPGWRFCHKCFGMFFNGDPDPNRRGRCPADGKHEAFGFVFYLPHDVPTGGQPDWRFCHKCFGMFFNGDPDPNRRGRCPAGGGHDAFGFDFVLPHRDFPTPSITIRAIATDARFIEVSGSGFEPNQTAHINHELRFSAGGFQPPGNPRTITIDSAGRLADLIPINSDISFAKVSAFDFGSGETAIATIE